jgi:ComF family protein
MKRIVYISIWFLREKIAKILSFLAFPVYCINCGKQTFGVQLCKECMQKYLFCWEGRETRCMFCGRHLISEIDICLECRDSPVFMHVDSVFPIHRYLLWKKQLMFLWKSGSQRLFSLVFAKMAYQALLEQYPGIPIVPVPPRLGKIHKTGWDQIAEVALILKNMYRVTVINALVRTEKIQQKKLNRIERLSHLEKAFKLSNKDLKLPKTVVILDDVMTTGATLEACAHFLKEAGVQNVYALTLFEVS